MTILIQKVRGLGGDVYAFRPTDSTDGFNDLVSSLPDLRYCADRRVWMASATPKTLHGLSRSFGRRALRWTYALVPKPGGQRHTNTETKASVAPNEYWLGKLTDIEEQLSVKRYSWRTIKSYKSHLRGFFAAHHHLRAKDITERDIRKYILKKGKKGNYAASTQHQLLNAIKFWFEHIEGRDNTFIDLRPKREDRLPTVLSVQEVKRLFAAVQNLKHRCILQIIYGGGLRLSEVCNLRIADIHSDRMQIFIHGGKGRKDRYTTLSKRALTNLRTYYKQYHPDYWLFEGQTGGQYSPRSVQAILKRAVKKSGINPYATVHTLRHSYATHLLESGVSLRHIQELLGHGSSVTTEIYTRVSTAEKQRVVSPLDRLEDD